MPVLFLIILILAAVVYHQRQCLQNYDKEQHKKRRALINYAGTEFPILRHVFRPGRVFEVQLGLIKYRDARIREAITRTLSHFPTHPSTEMIDFHVQSVLENHTRTPEHVHLLFQAKRTHAADWENLSENIKLQLKLINTLTRTLKLV